MMIRKRVAFIVFIVLVLVLIGWNYRNLNTNQSEATASIEQIKSGQDMTMYVTTDIHYLSESLTDHGRAFEEYVSSGDGKQLNDIEAIINAFSFEVKNKKPDVLIISGDLTNNGEKASHTDLAKKLHIIEENGVPIYVIPGNHDISNPWARSFKGDKQYTTDIIDEKDFRSIYADFGYDEAISKDKNTLSYLAAPSEDVWLLMLDTSQYQSNYMIGYPQTDGKLNSDTLAWIKECSDKAKEKGAKIIPVMHHNILNHSEVIRKGFTLNNNEDVLKQLQESHIKLVLSGHIHTQDISSYKNGEDTLYDIVTGSLAVNPHQYGVLSYSAKNQSLNYQTSKLDVENWARTNGIKDKDLLRFEKYSEEFFGKAAYNMASERLRSQESFSEEEIQSMSEVMKIFNIRYFAGIENENAKDIMNTEGYQLWSKAPDSFLKQYIMSVSSDKDTDDNHLQIEF